MEQALTNGGQTGKNAVPVVPNKFESADTADFFAIGLPGFTLPAWSPFFFRRFLSVSDFSWDFSQYASTAVYLHFRAFQLVRIRMVILVLGAKVIPGFDGKARSSLLFSQKISSPVGSIFCEKPCISESLP